MRSCAAHLWIIFTSPIQKKLVPFLDRVIRAGERAGALGGFLSGSGSTIVCVTLARAEKVAAAMRRASRLTNARHDHHHSRQFRRAHRHFAWPGLKISNSSRSTSSSNAATACAQRFCGIASRSLVRLRAPRQLRFFFIGTDFSRTHARLPRHQHRKPDRRWNRENANRRKICARFANRRTSGRDPESRLQKCAEPTKRAGSIASRGATDPPRIVSDGKSLLLDSLTAGDEPYMLANNLKDVIVLVDKDRVKSGLHAIREMKADTLLLDDGLQYLHLKHRLDIVLIDRQAPFGNEYLLPRGTLREPPRNLRRASYIFITKSTGEPNDELIERIRRYNRTAEIIECAHQPLYLQNVLHREQLPLENLTRHLHRLDLRHRRAGKLRGRPAQTRRAHRTGEALHRSSSLQRSGVAKFHQPLHSPRSGDDRDHGKGCGPFSAPNEAGGADLFSAGRDRNPERPRKLGALRRADLPAATDALAGTIFLMTLALNLG